MSEHNRMPDRPGADDPGRGRRLGIDVGTVRIGVAVSDPDGILATPVETVRRDSRGAHLRRIASLIDEFEIVEVVVGLPRTLADRAGSSARDAIDVAEAIAEIFSEVIIAPEFDADALAIFGKKKNLRLMRAKVGLRADTLREVRAVIGGVLVQDRDQKPANPRDFKIVTQRAPTADEMTALLFGWRVVRHVKSNAIVYAGKERTLSVGAGQMSRIDSSRIAVWKAGEAKLSLTGSAIASDAFFPFPDGLLAAADAGATCAIQPGGSVKDADVIAAADARGMAMVFTGMRHFKH